MTKTVLFRPTWRPTPLMAARGEYRDKVWPPGPQISLGHAAICFAARIPVYLHDKNRRNLFNLEMRALSHGCIRVARWDKLVATPAISVTIDYFLVFPNLAGEPGIYD